jgi:hypothetical protein
MSRTTGFGGSGAIDIVTTPRFAAAAGSQYMASIQVKTGASNTFKMLINWYADVAGGSFIGNSGTSVPFTVNGTQRCEIGPFTAPVGAGAGYLRIIELDSTTVTLSALMVEQTNVSGNTYFDGDSTGATWDGTAGNSTSTLSGAAETATWSDSGSVTVTPSGPTGRDTATFSASGSIVASGTVPETATWSDSGLIVGLVYDSRRGRVRVDAVGLPATAIRAVVDARAAGTTNWTPVRGGKVAISAGRFVHTVDDYEFASGVANTYRIRAYSTPDSATDIVVASAAVVLSAVLDEVWLKFIASPVLNQRVQLIDWSDISRPSRNAMYDVLGRTDPVAVLDVHGSRRVTVELRTATKAAAAELDYALSQGLPLFLHVPETVALPSLYAAAGDITSQRPSKTTQVQYWSVQLTEVAPPPASIVGAASTWQSILDGYASWSDVLAGFTDWQEAAS